MQQRNGDNTLGGARNVRSRNRLSFVDGNRNRTLIRLSQSIAAIKSVLFLAEDHTVIKFVKRCGGNSAECGALGTSNLGRRDANECG